MATAEEGKDTEDHRNCQAIGEDSGLEEEKAKNDVISLGKEEDLKEQGQDKHEHLENDGGIHEHKGKISEFEKQHENGENMKLETNDEGQQFQEEEETKLQHIDIEKDLEVDVKQTQFGAQVSETQQDVTESSYEETKEKKHIDQENSPVKQVKYSSSLVEHSDQKAAENSGLEIHQQNQREEHLSGGYHVTETAHVQEHPTKTKGDFSYPFNYHEDHGDHNSHRTPNTYEATALNQHRDVHTLTLSDKSSFPQHYPVYIAEEKHLPYPAQKSVPYPLKQHTAFPVLFPYTVHKPVPYPVKIPVDRPYFVHVPVEKKVPFPVHVQVPVPQPYTVHVPKPYAVVVEKKVPAPYPVRIEVPVSQPYPVEVKIPVAVPVDRPVPVPVKVPVDKPVPVPVEKPYPVTVQKEVYYPVQKTVSYPIKVCIFD